MLLKRLGPAAVLIGLLGVASAGADDAATGRKLEELERRQERLSEELRRLRERVEEPAAAPDRVDEVERRQGILTDELRRLREALVLPERRELKSAYGLGPAASKVYGIERGLSIGGYGEANFKNVVSDRAGASDEFDALRLVLYVGYKYSDRIVLNSEIEFEHATTGSTVSAGDGEVSLEFATLDFLLHPKANARAGLLLVPMGFINEIHEPPFFHGTVRPEVEQQIIPTTWRANGAGFFGELLPGLEYRTYGITSLNAKGLRAANLRDARQKGNRERAHDWSWVARLDYTLRPGTLLGGSLYLGDQGQDQTFGNAQDGFVKPGVFTQIYELHAQVRAYGLELRGLAAVVDIEDAAALNRDAAIKTADKPVADVLLGYYGEVAYDVLPLLLPGTTHYLAPWYRYSRSDTQHSLPTGVPAGLSANDRQDRDVHEVGLTYKPIPQVVLKLDYRAQDARTGSRPDELRLGGGFVF